MWSARRYPAPAPAGPGPRTNDIDSDERRQTIPQRGRPTPGPQIGLDQRCLTPGQRRWPQVIGVVLNPGNLSVSSAGGRRFGVVMRLVGPVPEGFCAAMRTGSSRVRRGRPSGWRCGGEAEEVGEDRGGDFGGELEHGGVAGGEGLDAAGDELAADVLGGEVFAGVAAGEQPRVGSAGVGGLPAAGELVADEVRRGVRGVRSGRCRR